MRDGLSQRERLLAELREAGEQGLCIYTMDRSLSYTARNRIGELRAAHEIATRSCPCGRVLEAAGVKRPAHVRYYLIVNPVQMEMPG